MATISVISLSVMVLFISVDVVGRYFFRRSIAGSYDISQFLLLVIVFGSWSYAQIRHKHVYVNMIITRLPEKAGFLVLGIVLVLSVLIGGLVTVEMWNQTMKALQQGVVSSTLYAPVYPVYGIATVQMGVFTLTLLLDAVKVIGSLFNQKLADEMRPIVF